MDNTPFTNAAIALLGKQVTLTFAAGGTSTIQAIDDLDYVDESVGVRSSRQRQRAIYARDADVANLAQGDGVTIGSVTCFVSADPEADGQGMTRVPLRKSA